MADFFIVLPAMSSNYLEQLLKNKEFSFVMRFDPANDPVTIIDLSIQNTSLRTIDIDDESSFCNFITQSIRDSGGVYGAGGYAEDRIIYSRSEVFEGDRSIHLGIDLWADAGEEIYAVCDGFVHSFRDNNNHGDYGPTIILGHEMEGITYYTLYGHLSKRSLENLEEGEKVVSGERIGWLGAYEENVHWPPHLHFQVISNLNGRTGDFPGVARPSEAAAYLSVCPDPNLILRIDALNNDQI